MVKKHSLLQCFYIIFVLATLCCSCHKDDTQTGKLSIQFAINVDNERAQYDTLMYVNASQNQYEINEVKFFISELKLYKDNGTIVHISDNRSIHYYDSQIASTHTWNISDSIPIGQYDSISFVFGLLPEKNITGYFVNPPENNMAWPAYLGGGYHYLQINGYWLREGSILTPFNLHTGMGQLYENDEITQFVPNHFTVTLPQKSFTISEDKATTIPLTMDVNQWFTNPTNYNFDVWGGSIMQNQAAQDVLIENGKSVFF